MKDVERIIVASDLSERSRPAVRRAVHLAADSQAKLTVLHVVDAAIPPDLSNQLQAGAQALLSEQVLEDAAGRTLSWEVAVVVGDAIEAVQQTAQTHEADLLIFGLHRKRTFFDHIRETTMEHLVRASRAPVLLAMGHGDAPYAQALVGVDLSQVCAHALNKVRMMAPQAALTLFHAHEISFRREAERDYKTWQALFPLPADLPDPVYLEATAADALEDMLDKAQYDLLAMGAHTRSNAGRYVLGGFSAKLIRNPPCDLLLAK